MNNLFTLLHFYTISINKKIHKNVDKITKKNNSFLVQLLYIDVVIMLCLNKAGIIKG